MTDRYENIRKALAMGPTPGPWVQDCDGVSAADEIVAVAICCRSDAEAAFIAACDPDTIRELLAERDALARDAERYRWLRDPCSGAERVIFYGRGDYGKGLMSGAMLDAAIDAAIDQARGEENGNG